MPIARADVILALMTIHAKSPSPVIGASGTARLPPYHQHGPAPSGVGCGRIATICVGHEGPHGAATSSCRQPRPAAAVTPTQCPSATSSSCSHRGHTVTLPPHPPTQSTNATCTHPATPRPTAAEAERRPPFPRGDRLAGCFTVRDSRQTQLTAAGHCDAPSTSTFCSSDIYLIGALTSFQQTPILIPGEPTVGRSDFVCSCFERRLVCFLRAARPRQSLLTI